MHFEFLVEDQSGAVALNNLIPKIIGENHSFKLHSYKGLGRIPKNLSTAEDPSKRILLDRLPKLLRGYGKTFPKNSKSFPVIIVVVCDLDARCMKRFRKELLDILDKCNPQPDARFCFAVEELEAWLLGDKKAIRQIYPKAKNAVLDSYINDSICGTWEKLANSIYPGGKEHLSKLGWHYIGKEKSKWAESITSVMTVDENSSPSFCYFRDTLKKCLSS